MLGFSASSRYCIQALGWALSRAVSGPSACQPAPCPPKLATQARPESSGCCSLLWSTLVSSLFSACLSFRISLHYFILWQLRISHMGKEKYDQNLMLDTSFVIALTMEVQNLTLKPVTVITSGLDAIISAIVLLYSLFQPSIPLFWLE